MGLSLPPIIGEVEADQVTGAVWCDVRWYLDGTDGMAAYLDDHISGAIFVDLDHHLADPATIERGRHPLPSAESFSASLGELGIGPDTPVIAYDDRQGVPAGRFVWMLRATGHEAALLDGGLDSWTGPRSKGEEHRRSCMHPVREWPDVLADADTTLASGSAPAPHTVVIDARAGERFRGEVEPMDVRAGHIPGAISVPYAGNLDGSGRFLTSAELRTRFEQAGVSPAADVINYCGSGVSACHNLLAMEYAGYPPGRLYPGSWSAWSADPDRPIATGA